MSFDEFNTFLRAQLADYKTHWSIGTFGALAEFMRDADEIASISDNGLSVVTDRGGIRLGAVSGMRIVASESPTRESWNHRVALCLPTNTAVTSGRDVLTELGMDEEALREAEREAVLFDLGLDAAHVVACIRISDRAVLSELRRCTGRNVFEAGNPAMSIIVPASPHRVFMSRVGRVEVFQPIPPSNGRSPEGPHTHVLPKLLQHRRTHSATEQIPDGFVPCAHFYPPHPSRDALGHSTAFNANSHVAFQQLLERFGDRDIVELKHRVASAIAQDTEPWSMNDSNLDGRFARAAVRVALRQLRASGAAPTKLEVWRRAYDASQADVASAENAEMEEVHV